MNSKLVFDDVYAHFSLLQYSQHRTCVKKVLLNVICLFIIVTVFKLLLEIRFAINMPSVMRLLSHHRQKCFLKMFKNCKAFLAFYSVILSIYYISFDNNMQWMHEIRMYNVEKYNLNKLNFPWEKTASQFCMIYNFTITITRIHLTICKVRSNNSNPVSCVKI